MLIELARKVRQVRYVLVTLVLGSIFIFQSAMPVQAGGVVGNGSPASCTEAALDVALAGGGTVTFNCGPAPQTILLTVYKQISEDTEIQGGDLISLSGGNTTSLFQVFSAKTLSMRDITLREGSGTYGAIQNFGTVTLTNTQLISNTASISGGAIENYGELNITDSVIAANEASQMGAGIYNDGGSVTLNTSTLRDNLATSSNGGGLYNTGIVTLTNVTISGNNGVNGGGIYNSGTATLTSSTLSGNSASMGFGGGIDNRGTAELTNGTLNGNSAWAAGGGLSNFGTATLTNIIFSGNSASVSGGGIRNYENAAITNAAFTGNSADTGGGIENSGTAMLTNVTLSGNSATYGGGIVSNNSATLTNVTLSGNSATISGGGIYRAAGTLTVKNSIVANSPTGGNCSGDVTDGGFNLATDPTCGFLSVDVKLDPLADNGGPTQTHMPQPGSPAIDFVVTGCPPPATDQRGGIRPVDGDGDGSAACDAGAVEVGAIVPDPLLLHIYVPLVVH